MTHKQLLLQIVALLGFLIFALGIVLVEYSASISRIAERNPCMDFRVFLHPQCFQLGITIPPYAVEGAVISLVGITVCIVGILAIKLHYRNG